jgi:nickel-dependent lactate racemase
LARLNLAIGSRTIPVEIDDSQVLAIKTIPHTASPQAIISRALENPVASETLGAIFSGTKQVIIVAPDKTRNCGANEILPILIEQLNACGIADANLKIVLATGTHAGHTRQQVAAILGSEISKRIEVFDHNCRDAENLTLVGETRFGTPVFINRRLLEADKTLVVAAALHHYFAGFGGGAKMINPGCAGYETISKNHALTIDPQTGGLHAGCRAGEVATNPVQMDIIDSMRFISANFLFETILNDAGKIVAAFAGEMMAAHRQACKLVDDIYKVNISERADLVVVSCGGYPKDINFIQSHKSLHNAFYAVKEGGVILALAECREGVGSQTFLEWFDFADDESFRAELTKNYKVNGTTALALKMKTRAARMILVSTLSAELVRKLGMIPAATFEEGWKLARKKLPQHFTSYIIPNGSLTVPCVN